VVGDGFVGGRAAEFVAEDACAFGKIGGPHLLEDVGEAGLEDAAGDRLEGRGEPEVGLFPPLLLVAAVTPERLGLFCRVTHAAIGPEDFARKLPYASKWSYGISLAYNQDTSFGSVGLRTSFNHRDRAFSNDANTSFIVPVNNLDASLALTSGRTTLSIYGKNLQNKLNFGLNSPQAYYPNAAFIPLNKGRVVGVQLEFSY